jgi:hypothetical protein
MAADIGLMPQSNKPVHARTCNTTDALCKRGSVVIQAGTTDSSACVTTTSAGANGVLGVVLDQGDPNNSQLIPSSASVSVADIGDVEILVLGSTAYAVGDVLITSTTAGVAKKLASETTADQIGTVLQKITTGTNPQLISCRLNIVKRAA